MRNTCKKYQYVICFEKIKAINQQDIIRKEDEIEIGAVTQEAFEMEKRKNII